MLRWIRELLSCHSPLAFLLLHPENLDAGLRRDARAANQNLDIPRPDMHISNMRVAGLHVKMP